MIDFSKRYQTPRPNDSKNLGRYVRWYIEKNKVKKGSISNALGILPTTLNQYFKQSSFQFSILWRISIAVNYNFLMDFGEQLDIPYQTKKEKELLDEIETLKKTIEKLEIENGVYKNITGAR